LLSLNNFKVGKIEMEQMSLQKKWETEIGCLRVSSAFFVLLFLLISFKIETKKSSKIEGKNIFIALDLETRYNLKV
jgi:hypothetical protein